MKLIDADKLCDDLMKRYDIADERNEWMIKGVLSNIVTPIIACQPTINQWIHVSEKLPKPFIKVLIYDRYGCFDISQYVPPYKHEFKSFISRGFWGDTDSFDYWLDDVVAWMPLPEPYRSENNE